MSQSGLRVVLSGLLALMLPAQLLAGDAASAMIYTNGPAWVNGSQVPKSAALFSGDMVQTHSDSTANINASGSSVMVLSDSMVKFQGPAVEIEHGAVRVSTSKGLAAQAGDVMVKPAGTGWTEFLVTDVDGTVQIAANKGDVTVQDQQGTTTLSQGQQTTRDENSEPQKKKHRKGTAGAATAAKGGILSTNTAIYTGLGVIGGVTAWVLLQSDEPLSPDCRTKSCN